MGKDLLNTSWEIWDFLIEEAGLDIKNYDLPIVDELCKVLGISLPCKDIKRELQNRDISSELFIESFLKSIQPYAQMMSELCIFFYLHGIKRTNNEMKILFDFGKGPEDFGFDLKHFREGIWKYRRASRKMAIYGWNHNTLWSLAEIFRDFWNSPIEDSNVEDWLFNYREHWRFNIPLPIIPTTRIKEIDLWLQRVWQVWATIILECRKYGSTRSDLRKHIETRQKESIELSEKEMEDEEDYESLRRFQELPDFKDWDVKTLFHIDHDRWPESMLKGLVGFTEELLRVSKSERTEKAQPVIQQIQKLFSDLPYWEGEREVLIKELLELLNLPIWKKRHELYQTWILSQIDKTIKGYQRTIHHVNGSLILRFSGTHVGVLETEKGRLHIWSELRSPLANPLGKGRKGHIQPDYSIVFEPITDPNQTAVAIECKQYRKANSKNFAHALIDYAKGRPNAKVILVNYGHIPERIFNQIDDGLKPRILMIGNFVPDRPKEFDIFRETIIESIPKEPKSLSSSKLFEIVHSLFEKRPPTEEELRRMLGAGNEIEEMQFDLIAVDISGSMKDVLNLMKKGF